MNMKCRDLSELRSLKKIKLIAGAGGLDHNITWVYINQDSSISDWIHGGELVFITDMENGFSVDTLVSIVRDLTFSPRILNNGHSAALLII